MERVLAREMAAINKNEVREAIDLRKLAMESDEIKQLKIQINQAILNKQRAGQIAETQFRNQMNLVSIEITLILYFVTFHRKTTQQSR